MTTERPVVAPLGDAALLVTFGTTISRALAATVSRTAERIAEAELVGVTDIVPSYAALAVYIDPDQTTLDAVSSRITTILDEPSTTQTLNGRIIVIPVRYDGPDVSAVAEQTGLTVAAVIERHWTPTYYAYTLGFVPGFAYLGELDPALVLPRRTTPRQRVPAGSVAIAGAQTAIYPLSTPGGWHLLGTTPLLMFDPHRDPPTLIRPGDTVRFEPIHD